MCIQHGSYSSLAILGFVVASSTPIERMALRASGAHSWNLLKTLFFVIRLLCLRGQNGLFLEASNRLIDQLGFNTFCGSVFVAATSNPAHDRASCLM